jgi:DNA repair exonuclease SbcCD ATPase subunit
LVLIQGVNNDDTSAKSNGSGKSSIADAISWCLFGETARGESGDSIVNEKAGKDAYVSLELRPSDDGAESDYFIVTRHRKHRTEKNRLVLTRVAGEDGRADDLTGGTDRITQGTLEGIIGCSASVFSSAIYAGQERMPDIPSMTDKQLKELLEEAAGISELQTYYATAKTWLAKMRVSLTTSQTEAARLRSSVEMAEEMVTNARNAIAKWSVDHVARLNAERKSIEDKFDGMDEEEITLKIAKLEVVAKRLADNFKALSTAKPSKDETEEALRAELSKADKQVLTIQAANKVEGKEILKLRGELESLEARIGTPCGECGKQYEEADLDSARKARTAGLRDRVKRYKGMQEALSNAITAQDRAGDALDAYLASRPSQEEARDAILEAQKRKLAADQTVSDVKRQLRELKEAKARLKDLVEMENPHIDQLESASARQKELQEKLEVAERETEVFQKKADLYEQAAEVFGPAGVRAHILDNVTPFLNSKTGHYLSLLSDGNITATWSTLSTTAKGELRERFVIEVAKATGGKSFGLLSGGEKRKVRLACALALQDLVATRASKPFRLFVADEIDDALDDAGLERLMSVLDEKAKERGTVLVISHNSLSDWIREVVTVEMTDGQSTVRGPICPSE